MDEIIGVAEDQEPDTSDLAMVIINVETRDGRQLARAFGPEVQGDVVSMTMEYAYGSDEFDFEEWTIKIKRTSP